MKIGKTELLDWEIMYHSYPTRHDTIIYPYKRNPCVWIDQKGQHSFKVYFAHDLFYLNNVFMKIYGEWIEAKSISEAQEKTDDFLRKIDVLRIFM